MSAAEKLCALYEALYAPPMTAEDIALHERLVAREIARAEVERGDVSKFRDCLEFAMAYGMSGTPRYQAEALRCLEVAAEMIRGGSGH